MNAVLDVAQAVDSTDCAFPGCPYEATAGGMCRDHQGRTPSPPGAVTATHDSRGRLIPGALAHLMHDDDQPDEPDPFEIGPHGGDEYRPLPPDPDDDLVVGHPEAKEKPVTQRVWNRDNIIEAIQAFHNAHGRTPRQPELRAANRLPATTIIRREFGSMAACFEAAGLEGPGRGGARASRPTGVKPPPATKPPVAAATPGGSIVELAQAVETAAADLEHARNRHANAIHALKAALEAA